MGTESDTSGSNPELDYSDQNEVESNGNYLETRVIKTKQYRCMIVGDLGVGKTSLLATHATGNFPGEHVPTVFGSFAAPMETLANDNGITRVDMEYIDTTSQDGYDQQRIMSYNSCNIIMICFSVTSQTSLENVSNKWLPEIDQHAPLTPFLLVANKIDSRKETTSQNSNTPWICENDNDILQIVKYKEGLKTAKRLGAQRYVECSAMTRQGVSDVFQQVRDVVTSHQKRRRSKRERAKDGLSSLFCGFSRH